MRNINSYNQIQKINDLEYYIKLPTNLPRVKFKLQQPKMDIRNDQPFVERDIAIDQSVQSKIKKRPRLNPQQKTDH